MITNLKEADIVTEGFVGNAKAVVIPAKESLDIMTDLLLQHPEDYLCDSTGCLWCREIERRLRLYDKVRKRKWFQKHACLRFPVDTYNYFRLKDIAALSLSMHMLRAIKKKTASIFTTKTNIGNHGSWSSTKSIKRSARM